MVTEMVRLIGENGSVPGVGRLHANYYEQISGLYLHGGPLGLIRHVHPRTERTSERPYSVWSKRAAVHTGDAMDGLLAASVAGTEHPDHALFRKYEADHSGVTWSPLALIVRGLAVTRIRPQYMPRMVEVICRLRAKLRAGQTLTEADVDELLAVLSLLTRLEPDDPSFAASARAIRSGLLQKVQPAEQKDSGSATTGPR